MQHLINEVVFWEFIEDSLISDHRCVLLKVVDHQGSSPGRAGFALAVNLYGEIAGSIGGGVMEHKLVELSKQVLLDGSNESRLIHQIHRKEATSDRSGMICSGQQKIALIPLSDEHLDQVKTVMSSLKNQTPQVLVLSDQGLQLVAQSEDSGLQEESNEAWSYYEPLLASFTLHLVGGGHISLALSKLAVQLGFRVKVYDHRKLLPTIAQNVFAEEKVQVNYHSLPEQITEGIMHFIAIMTVGYRTDMEAIQNLLGGSYGYLGLLGSQAKIKQLFNELFQQGYSKELLDSIDAPAGLPIGSQTPHEIAVSIGASLIQARRRILDRY